MKTLYLPLKKKWYEMIERGEKHGFADCVAQSTKLGGGCVKCKRSLKKDFAEIAACFDKTRPGEHIALYQVGKDGIEPLAVHK